MIDKKLESLFSELTEEEINLIEKSDVDTDCNIDPKVYSSILARVRAKTQAEVAAIPVVSAKEKQQHKQVKGRKLKAILVAAAVFIVLAIGTGAAYQFMLPDGLNEQLELHEMNIKTVVDIDKADENSVKTVQKTVNSNGYTVNFEAIVDGYVILPDIVKSLRGLDTSEEIREDRIYAVMTITRDDGKNVFFPDENIACDCCRMWPDFIVAVKGYAPNFITSMGTPWIYEEGNVMYFLCDITDVAKFADRDLSLIIYNSEFVYEGMIARMDENGEYYLVDTYDDLGAIFDFDLDDSLADPEAVAKDMAERPFVYVTDPDYTLADEMIAKNEAVKKMDLSYAIGNHSWHGWFALQFGDIPYAETFIELFANKSELAKTDLDVLKKFIDEESERLDVAVNAEIERLSGKALDLMTSDEFNEISEEINAFIEKNEEIKADTFREKFDFVKLEGGSEYCYIDEFTFLYIPAGSEYAEIVVVYGDRIVISLECTVDTLRNHYDNELRHEANSMSGSMYAYWYLFGVDEDSRYAKLYNEEDFKLYSQSIRSEQDAIFSLISEYTYYDGTVEVLGK